MLKKENKGITLIALVVTIIILIILVGVSINLVLGENGLIELAKRAKENTEDAMEEEQIELDNLYMEMSSEAAYNKDKNVNIPMLLKGMSPIKFIEPTENEDGSSIKTNSKDVDWYDYNTGKWANSQTEDGSMWVWIPRYAYKITYYTDDTKTIVSDTKTLYGSIDVKFLIGLTDNYYNEDGSIATAQRQRTVDEIIDTTADYTVHPAFTNEKSIGYANGGWRKELTGIWVAKFEAGYASGNNTAPVKASSVKYTEPRSSVGSAEKGNSNDSRQVARNYLDGIYSKEDAEGTMTYDNGVTKYSWINGEVAIKYPTFQGITYSMNYINHNDAYNIARVLTENGNIYGFNENQTDSHLMKNSEWGAAAYLSQSKCGLNGEDIYINNVSLNNTTKSIYAVTGMAGNSPDVGTRTTTIDAIKNKATNDIYTWKQKNGVKASTTGTIYGIYDMSGGLLERMSCFVYNGNESLEKYGKSLLNDGISTEYTTIYPHNDSDVENVDVASIRNFNVNTKIYGDGIRETAIKGIQKYAWYTDYTYYPGYYSPFFQRSGGWNHENGTGLFLFDRFEGSNYCNSGFRVVLVTK